MSAVTYQDLVTKSFRDNAIRSVMLIDDDFLPYDELVNKLSDQTIPSTQTAGLARAANLHSFFQKSKKIICDIDSGTQHLDVNKIRKSDLVVLDYELERGNPNKSIQLISNLRDSVHMNLVVLYTQETDLEKVWLTIATALRGCASAKDIFEDTEVVEAKWDEITQFGSEKPEEWIQRITNEDLTSYILTGSVTPRTTSVFGKEFKNEGKFISRMVCEYVIQDHYKVNFGKNDIPIIGENGEVKWLQSGNVFVVLHNKVTGVNESEELWNALEVALHRWHPSYYRLLLSEIQNLLENESVSFGSALKSDPMGQAAWLHQIISESDSNQKFAIISQFMDCLTDELKIKVVENKELRATISEVVSYLSKSAQTAIQDEIIEMTKAEDVARAAEAKKIAKELEASDAEVKKATAASKVQVNATFNAQLWKQCDTVKESFAQKLTEVHAAADIVEQVKEMFSAALSVLTQSSREMFEIVREEDRAAKVDVSQKNATAKAAKMEADQAISNARKISERAERSLIKFSAEHVKANASNILQFETEMFHALNSDLCSRMFSGAYVTTGTVLTTAHGDWFLCVSPACETVPEQHTGGAPTKRIAPHRLMKLIVLVECKIKAALEKAVEGRHIFIKDEVGERRAFAVQSGDAHQPTIDFAVIHEHDQSIQKEIHKDGIIVSFLDRKEKTGKLFAKRLVLKPIAQLRESYAARFQTVASQHAGRVGVDFISVREAESKQDTSQKKKVTSQYIRVQKHCGESCVAGILQAGTESQIQSEDINASER